MTLSRQFALWGLASGILSAAFYNLESFAPAISGSMQIDGKCWPDPGMIGCLHQNVWHVHVQGLVFGFALAWLSWQRRLALPSHLLMFAITSTVLYVAADRTVIPIGGFIDEWFNLSDLEGGSKTLAGVATMGVAGAVAGLIGGGGLALTWRHVFGIEPNWKGVLGVSGGAGVLLAFMEWHPWGIIVMLVAWQTAYAYELGCQIEKHSVTPLPTMPAKLA